MYRLLKKPRKRSKILLDFRKNQEYSVVSKGGGNMDFFKELYNGDIYPAEEIAVDIASDPKYKELSPKLAEAGKQAENADDETQ